MGEAVHLPLLLGLVDEAAQRRLSGYLVYSLPSPIDMPEPSSTSILVFRGVVELLNTAQSKVCIGTGDGPKKQGWLLGIGIEVLVGGHHRNADKVVRHPVPASPIVDIVAIALRNPDQFLANMAVHP